MRQNPSFAMTDVAELRRLIDQNPWMTLVSDTPDGLVASHYAVLLDEDRDDLTIVGHVGKPDDMIHGLGERELLVVVQGPHGYISPGWYGEVQSVPTWNFVSAHLSGIPEVLTPEENLQVLDRLVARFEGRMPEPRLMWERPNDPDLCRAAGTRNRRLPADAHARRRQAQAQPEQGRRCRRDHHRRAERRRAVREPGTGGRDAPRPRRDGAPVTAVGATVGTIRGARVTGSGRELLPTDGPVDIFLANGVIADIAPAGALRATRRDPRRRRRMARAGPVGPPRPRGSVVARRAARAARARGVGRPRGTDHGAGERPGRRAARRHRVPRRAVARQPRRSTCSMRRPATSRPT